MDSSAPFTPKRTHLDYIANKDDVWFTEQTTEVLLRVAPYIAHYFARRQLLPQQQHRQDSDGSLLVTTQINHINQLLPVVRYWLPHVRIVQPQAWHEELVRDCGRFWGGGDTTWHPFHSCRIPDDHMDACETGAGASDTTVSWPASAYCS